MAKKTSQKTTRREDKPVLSWRVLYRGLNFEMRAGGRNVKEEDPKQRMEPWGKFLSQTEVEACNTAGTVGAFLRIYWRTAPYKLNDSSSIKIESGKVVRAEGFDGFFLSIDPIIRRNVARQCGDIYIRIKDLAAAHGFEFLKADTSSIMQQLSDCLLLVETHDRYLAGHYSQPFPLFLKALYARRFLTGPTPKPPDSKKNGRPHTRKNIPRKELQARYKKYLVDVGGTEYWQNPAAHSPATWYKGQPGTKQETEQVQSTAIESLRDLLTAFRKKNKRP